MKQLILIACLTLTACVSQKTQSSVKVPAMNIVASEVKAETKIDSDFLISENGIGKARLGMTLGELKQVSDQDTEFKLVSSFMPDLNAIAVSKDGLVQYYVLYGDAATPSDESAIVALVTNNHNYETSEGVKVGTLIQEAEEIYGDAILAYNFEGESQEYITFNKNNAKNVRFRASFFKLISDGMGFSGIYPEYPGVSYTTDKYHSDAAIAAIEVACPNKICSY